MLLQLKVYSIGFVYLLGAFFMILFPPRNFHQSGARLTSTRRASSKLLYESFISYEGIVNAADKIAKEDPELATVVRLKPSTSENRSIIALELHSDKQSQKPGILIIGALDAMAWGAANAILELAEKMLHDSNYQTPFFNDYDWYLVPLANPDGLTFGQAIQARPAMETYVWSQNKTVQNRTRPKEWRKNVQKNEKADCFGTHVNRNFAYHWQDDNRKTPNYCSQYYPGNKPFSTPEAQALRAYVDKLEDTINFAIHLHASFIPKKDLMVYPWRYTRRPTSNMKSLQDIGEYAARLSRLPDGRVYEVHQSSNDGTVAGSLLDYLAGVVGTDLLYLLKPYHQLFPKIGDTAELESYVNRAMTAMLNLVRGWRKNDKKNTLSFFGKDIEF